MDEGSGFDGMFGVGLTAEGALRRIVALCCAEIDAHLALVLDSDAPEGVHKARVWLRRLVAALDAFHPILKRRATAQLRAEAKDIFHMLGKVRDRDVVLEGLAEAERPAKLVAYSLRVRQKLRNRLRARSAVLFAPLVLRAVDEAALFRSGARAVKLRLGGVDAIAVVALDQAWHACRDRQGDLRELGAGALHGFRKNLKTLRYLSEFFAPFLVGDGVEGFRGDLQEMQDLLGVATDAQAVTALGKASAKGSHRQGGNERVAQALDRAARLWHDVARQSPWWRRPRPEGVLH